MIRYYFTDQKLQTAIGVQSFNKISRAQMIIFC